MGAPRDGQRTDPGAPSRVPAGQESSDTELLAGIVERRQVAFAEIYDRHSRPVAWLAHSRVPAHLVDDVLQATFITLWDNAHRIALSGASLLPWLMGTCRIHCKAALRKEHRHRHEAATPELAGGNVEEEALQRQLLRAIDQHVAGLSQLDQQIYRLCIHEDLGYKAAAQKLGITPSALRNRLSRLRTGVRRRFGSD